MNQPLEAAGIALSLSVGEVAWRSGMAVSTLHCYEAKGLISSRRSAGNQRRYARDVLRRVAFIPPGAAPEHPTGGHCPGARHLACEPHAEARGLGAAVQHLARRAR